MKGVMLGICPDATLVDISHDISAAGRPRPARSNSTRWVRYFPHRTMFLVVVDPGVGSSRRGMAADGEGLRFVGPDNGVFSLVLEDTPGVRR